ncbi:uncharacterized protein C15orf39 homolog isoform 2-T3 [Anomaloglossus baeobatrachus]|uniref:uncharacterized protein C15orf39 homolog isoform X2 n=1 Tax=Anomaloglossus baeobatrachus TaxID=238106 RepID=UPI003F50CA5F
MAGKKHFGAMDHMLHHKLSRLESAPQHSTACFGIAATQDLQTCQNFRTYSMADAEGHGSSSPWSSSAYLQYAGSTLNEHLQTREASGKYQRSPTERPHNSLQPSDNPNNQVSVYQNPQGHSYHMPYPRAYPPIAMPRPVYRSTSNFMDATYGSRGFQCMGVASTPACPSAVEWSASARFDHSSSPLCTSATKKHHSMPNTYPEVAGSPTSLSHSAQEHNSNYRLRADLSLGVGVSATCSQKDIFTDACYSVAQPNVLYAEGNQPLRKHRSSAFTALSPQHKKPSAFQGSLDHQMGHLHSKPLYSNTKDSIRQRSSPLSTSMDLTRPPHSVMRGTFYPNRAHQIPVCSPERGKNLWVHSSQMNQDICGMSSKVNKEMFFNSTPTNRQASIANYYRDPFTGPSTHAAFVQQSTSSVITPAGSSHELFSGQHASRHSVTLKESSLHSSIQSYKDSRVTGVQAVENTTTIQSSTSHITLEHAESIVPSPSSVSIVGSQYQMNHNNVKSRHDALSPECELKVVETDEPKSAPTSVLENVNFDNPKSPPMPVINDVFSLAPYRDYLEGKAPHPFSTHQESEAENAAPTSDFSEGPVSDKRTEKAAEICRTAEEVGAKNVNVAIQDGECVQTGEVSVEKTCVEPEVLDLSLKKLPQSSSLPCDEQEFSCREKDTLLSVSAVKLIDKVGNQSQSQEDFRSSDTSRIFQLEKEHLSSETASNIEVKSQSSCPPVDKWPFRQENRLLNGNVLCQRQGNIVSQGHKSSQWMLQENCQSQVIESQNKLEESSVSLTTKNFSNCHQEDDHSGSTQRFLSQHQKSSPSQMIECLPQLRKTYSSPYKSKSHFIADNYKSQSKKNLFLEPQDNNSPRLPESNDLSSNTSKAVMTLPVHTSVQHSSRSDLSIFVNNLQSQRTILPVVVTSSPNVYFTNTIALQVSQPPFMQRPKQVTKKKLELHHSLSSPSSSENESNGFHSSKSFMFRKFKMNRFSSSEEETHQVSTESISHNVSNPFLSDTVQSLPPSAPESSPALGEANVSLASVGEASLSSPGEQFSELHRSVHTAITRCVARSPSSLLEDWLSKTKQEEGSKTPVKAKNNSRSNDQSLDLPNHDIWLAFDGVRLLLHKLLSQLETFMFTRSCPFPHVIRAGAIFIPIYLVKEVLFSELLGPAIDRVLQKHKVELRPTTLSEEKLLRETKLKDCPSRMLKLLALKQLPDVYPDLLCLFCRHTIEQQLGSRTQSGQHTLK